MEQNKKVQSDLYKTFEQLVNGAVQKGLFAKWQDIEFMARALHDLSRLQEENISLSRRVSELEKEKELATNP